MIKLNLPGKCNNSNFVWGYANIALKNTKQNWKKNIHCDNRKAFNIILPVNAMASRKKPNHIGLDNIINTLDLMSIHKTAGHIYIYIFSPKHTKKIHRNWPCARS